MPLWTTPMHCDLLLCNFHKNYAPQASLLKSSIVELTDNSITVASELEDVIQYGQNCYCGHNSVVKSSTDQDSSFKLFHGLCKLYIPHSNTANTYTSSCTCDFRLLPQCKWDVRSSEILCTAVFILYRYFGTTYLSHLQGLSHKHQ
jgi:hypothetical protein